MPQVFACSCCGETIKPGETYLFVYGFLLAYGPFAIPHDYDNYSNRSDLHLKCATSFLGLALSKLIVEGTAANAERAEEA